MAVVKDLARIAMWFSRFKRVVGGVMLLCCAVPAHAASSTFPVFWVAGDPQPIAAAFKGLAAFFGNGNFAHSVMASAMTAAALMGLVMALLASVTTLRFTVGQWFVGTVLAMALFQPSSSVTVKSYFDDTAAMVSPRMIVIDHVPIGIAYPAGMASMFSKTVSDKFLEWFADTHSDVSASSDGAGGLMSPLKLIMKMNALYACASDNTVLCSNLREFLQDCPVEGGMASVMRENAGFYRLMNNSDMAGSTIFYNYDSGQVLQEARSCRDAGPRIYDAMSQYAAGSGVASKGVLDDLIGKSTASEPGEIDNGEQGASSALQGGLDNLSQKFNDATGADSNALMVNLLFCHVVQAGWQATSAKADAALVFAKAMSEARAKAASAEAGSSSMFESFMTSAMNLFSFLFVATAPIIILVGIVMGMAGFRVYGSWLLFGVWSQSWLPIANLISFYMMSSFWSRLAEFQSAKMFGCQNIEHFYHQVASVIYTGSSMMASVPIITLSLISGSMVAMSSLAGRATGGGRGVDPGIDPGHGNPNPQHEPHGGDGHAVPLPGQVGGAHAIPHTVSHAAGRMVDAANEAHMPDGVRHAADHGHEASSRSDHVGDTVSAALESDRPGAVAAASSAATAAARRIAALTGQNTVGVMDKFKQALTAATGGQQWEAGDAHVARGIAAAARSHDPEVREMGRSVVNALSSVSNGNEQEHQHQPHFIKTTFAAAERSEERPMQIESQATGVQANSWMGDLYDPAMTNIEAELPIGGHGERIDTSLSKGDTVPTSTSKISPNTIKKSFQGGDINAVNGSYGYDASSSEKSTSDNGAVSSRAGSNGLFDEDIFSQVFNTSGNTSNTQFASYKGPDSLDGTQLAANDATDSQTRAAQYHLQSQNFGKAADWMYANGNKMAGDAYRQMSVDAFYAARKAESEASTMYLPNDSSKSSASSTAATSPFDPNWNTGEFSAGIDPGSSKVKTSIGAAQGYSFSWFPGPFGVTTSESAGTSGISSYAGVGVSTPTSRPTAIRTTWQESFTWGEPTGVVGRIQGTTPLWGKQVIQGSFYATTSGANLTIATGEGSATPSANATIGIRGTVPVSDLGKYLPSPVPPSERRDPLTEMPD
jgi:hypothetical protein